MKTPRIKVLSAASAALIAVIALGSTSALAGEGKHQRKTLEGPAATATQSGGGKGLSGEKREGPMDWLRATILSVNPTEEQKTKIKAIAEEGRTAHEQWRTAHESEIKAFQEEMSAARNGKDKEKLKSLKDKGAKLYASAPKMTETLDKIRAVLTPEQQTKFDAAVASKKAEMKGKFFEGGSERMGGRKGDKGEKSDKGGKGEKGGETLSL